MTWAKLDDNFCDHPILLGLPRGVRLVNVEATVWSCKQETDGFIPTGAPPRFTDEPDVAAAVAALVEVGLWEVVERGWQLVDFHKAQRRSADIAQDRYEAAERQARSRAHHRDEDHSECLVGTFCKDGKVKAEDIPSRRHKKGDHSLCLVDDCRDGRVTRDERRDLRRSSPGESREPDPARPDPPLKKGREGKVVGPPHLPATAPPSPLGVPLLGGHKPTFVVRQSKPVTNKAVS